MLFAAVFRKGQGGPKRNSAREAGCAGAVTAAQNSAAALRSKREAPAAARLSGPRRGRFGGALLQRDGGDMGSKRQMLRAAVALREAKFLCFGKKEESPPGGGPKFG